MFRNSKRFIIPLLTGSVCIGLAQAVAQLNNVPASPSPLNLPPNAPDVTAAQSAPAPNSASTTNAKALFAAQPTLLATLQAHDSSPDTPSESTPKFDLRGFTPDGAKLLISKNEIGKPINDFADEVDTTFEVVDLTNGATQPLMKIQSDADFYFGSAETGANPLAYSSSTTTQSEKPWLFFEPARDAAPPKDVMQFLTPGASSGRVVYVKDVPIAGTGENTQWGTFLTLRRFGNGIKGVQNFPVQSNNFSVFGPQWAPDGARVLLKVGVQGDSIDRYLIYLWNPQKGRIEQGPKEEISYLRPRWSPDSARIAYLVGGDINGNNGFLARAPTSLHVYDVASKQSRKLVTAVSDAQGSLSQFQWQDAISLLYTAYPALQVAKEPRPAIYQIAATGGAAKLVVPDAFRPIPSPDNRWIAFFGWPDADNAADEIKANPQSRFYGPRLFLWNRQAKRRSLIQPNIFGAKTQLIWTPDSSKLVLLQSSYDSDAKQGTARISTLDVKGN